MKSKSIILLIALIMTLSSSNSISFPECCNKKWGCGIFEVCPPYPECCNKKWGCGFFEMCPSLVDDCCDNNSIFGCRNKRTYQPICNNEVYCPGGWDMENCVCNECKKGENCDLEFGLSKPAFPNSDLSPCKRRLCNRKENWNQEECRCECRSFFC